jgi:hypothetical protein
VPGCVGGPRARIAPSASSADRRRSLRPTRGRIAPLAFGGERRDDRAAPLEPGLPGHEFVDFAGERLEIDRPAARGLVEPRAGFCEAALISPLDSCLPRDHRPHQVVVEGEIGADRGAPDDQDDRERRDCP